MTPLEEQVEKLAREFHENYEMLAPHYGYETRVESAVPWEDVPGNNRRLMKATIRALLPLEVTDESVTVTLSREEAKVLLMADHHVECDPELEALQDSALDKLSAALTQKGEA